MVKIEEILSLTQTNAWDLVKRIRDEKDKIKFGDKLLSIDDVLDMYDPNRHAVHDRTKRQDKVFSNDIQTTDDSGRTTTTPGQTGITFVNRASVPYQKMIVERANSFLTGNPIEYIANAESDKEKAFAKIVERVMESNKMDFQSQIIGEKYMSETECAELWYIVDENDTSVSDYYGLDFSSGGLRLRMRLLAKSLGDDLYPIFDKVADMVAFGRGYEEKLPDNKIVEYFEIYTKDFIIFLSKDEDVVSFEYKLNLIGKIPVMYYKQAAPEWLHVQHNITRIETIMSNLGDTNDYLGDPTTVIKGSIKGLAPMGSTGKVLEIGKDASVELLEWSNQIASVETEKSFHKETVFSGTSTPDLSLENMKSLGAYSYIALKMFFVDPHLKVKAKEPVYLMAVQRRINWIKAALVVMDNRYAEQRVMQIKPKITPYMPEDDEARVVLLSQAYAAGMISRETAVRLNPLIEDADAELARLEAEDEKRFGEELVNP